MLIRFRTTQTHAHSLRYNTITTQRSLFSSLVAFQWAGFYTLCVSNPCVFECIFKFSFGCFASSISWPELFSKQKKKKKKKLMKFKRKTENACIFFRLSLSLFLMRTLFCVCVFVYICFVVVFLFFFYLSISFAPHISLEKNFVWIKTVCMHRRTATRHHTTRLCDIYRLKPLKNTY